MNIHTQQIDTFTTRHTAGDTFVNVTDIGGGWFEATAYQRFDKRTLICVNSRSYRAGTPAQALQMLADDSIGYPRAIALLAK